MKPHNEFRSLTFEHSFTEEHEGSSLEEEMLRARLDKGSTLKDEDCIVGPVVRLVNHIIVVVTGTTKQRYRQRHAPRHLLASSSKHNDGFNAAFALTSICRQSKIIVRDRLIF